VVGGVEEVWGGGGLGEGENRVCGVERSDRTSSLYGRVMWVVSKSLQRNGECQASRDLEVQRTMTGAKFVESQAELIRGR